jgi:hypothetical protein
MGRCQWGLDRSGRGVIRGMAERGFEEKEIENKIRNIWVRNSTYDRSSQYAEYNFDPCANARLCQDLAFLGYHRAAEYLAKENSLR